MTSKNWDRNHFIKPFLTIPLIPPVISCHHLPKKVEVYEYYTVSDGESKSYKEVDGIPELGKQVILAPSQVSYMNLFINGVLQPKDCYAVQKGEITLKTEDVPPKGAPVILQMLKF
ncbi:hypothetical protein CHH80_06240 [Bacillus sp. 7504-2]|nr:hypothetical protein CHH80_06240 [Bacillus sp. 7504-2]